MPDRAVLPAEYTLRQFRARDPNVRVFYKYQAFRGYTVSTLAEQKFFLAKYKQLNDPFDLFLTQLLGNSKNSSLQEAMSDVGIFCVSEDPDNQLLWAHYADSYQGFCIGYAAYVVPIPRVLHPLRYIKHLPKKIFTPELLSPQELLEWYLTSKPLAWSYEREWRFIIGGRVGLESNAMFPVVEIIFGPRMPLAQRWAIVKATQSTEPTIRVAQPTVLSGRMGIVLAQWNPA